MNIDTSAHRNPLTELATSLAALCELLELDERCVWTKHFQTCLATTRTLWANGFDATALADLSGAIRSVFGGMGSFNDYQPIMNTKASSAWYQMHGDPSHVIGAVYTKAMDLLVVGERDA